MEEIYFNIIIAVYEKLTTYTILNGEMLKALFLRSRKKTRVLTLTISVQHSTGRLSQINQARKRNERHPDKKQRSKIASVCRKHDLIYRKS